MATRRRGRVLPARLAGRRAAVKSDLKVSCMETESQRGEASYSDCFRSFPECPFHVCYKCRRPPRSSPFRRAGQFSPGRAVRPADRLARFLDGLERRRRFGAAGARAWSTCAALMVAAPICLRAIGGRGRRGGRPARFRACRAGGELGLLPAWDGARELLAALRPHSRLGVVTNCSRALGHRAAALLGVDWDVVVTSEEAGYKPDPRPYQLALARLDVQPGAPPSSLAPATICSAPAAWACGPIGTTGSAWRCRPARPSRNANRRAWPRRCRGWRVSAPESLPALGIGRPQSVARTRAASTNVARGSGALLAWISRNLPADPTGKWRLS